MDVKSKMDPAALKAARYKKEAVQHLADLEDIGNSHNRILEMLSPDVRAVVQQHRCKLGVSRHVPQGSRYREAPDDSPAVPEEPTEFPDPSAPFAIEKDGV